MAFKIKRFIPASPIKAIEGAGQGNVYGRQPKSQATKDGEAGYEADDKARKNKTGIYAPKPIQGPNQKIEFDTGFGKKGTDFVTGKDARKEVEKRKTTSLETNTPPRARKKVSTIQAPKAKKIKSTIKAPKASDVDVSNKPTGKLAPKDNSRKAIRKRKKADKAAGVSKSQMRANKAKSKSEAALEKAKKSKNPSYRAQLKRKSDRLAKRAKRKGGSPVKEVKEVKKPSKKNIDKNPEVYFKSFPNNRERINAKNPYPKDSDRARKFDSYQKKLKGSSF